MELQAYGTVNFMSHSDERRSSAPLQFCDLQLRGTATIVGKHDAYHPTRESFVLDLRSQKQTYAVRRLMSVSRLYNSVRSS